MTNVISLRKDSGMDDNEMILKTTAIKQVRNMAFSFAELYFSFVLKLYTEFGDETATETVTDILFKRAKERALIMIEKAKKFKMERIPENINVLSDVPRLGWDETAGCKHCPYGVVWVNRIKQYPWFRKYASLYCDVTDTTIAEVFTGCYSHKIIKNVVLGDDCCQREYFLSDRVKEGIYTYDK
ncbi:MAG: hypothetical protein ACOX1F_05705 [Erysipelotrichaceae bacterium]|jgi:hypothetical protein